MATSSDDTGRKEAPPGKAEGPEIPSSGSSPGKARRLLVSTPVVSALLMLLFSVVVALAWYASEWKREVRVSRVVVVGLDLLSRRKYEKAFEPFRGRKLAELRDEEIRRVFSQEPYVREMQIARELNGIVRVTVTERVPLARTLFQGRPMIIDTEGRLLPDNGVSGRFHRLPAVYDITGAVPVRPGVWRIPPEEAELVGSIVTAFAASEYAGLLLREIHVAQANQSWFLATGSPIRFIIGNDGNFKEKLKKFEIFWQKVIAKKGLDCYESVDLRFRERVFAKEPQVPGASLLPPSPAPAAPFSLPDVNPVPH